MEADYILQNGKKVDGPLYEDMLNNKDASTKSKEMAVKQAMKIGFSLEEARKLCGLSPRKDAEEIEEKSEDWTSIPFEPDYHPRDENGVFIPQEELEKNPEDVKEKPINSAQIHPEKRYKVEVEDFPDGSKKYTITHIFSSDNAAKLAYNAVVSKYRNLGGKVREHGRNIVAEILVTGKKSESKEDSLPVETSSNLEDGVPDPILTPKENEILETELKEDPAKEVEITDEKPVSTSSPEKEEVKEEITEVTPVAEEVVKEDSDKEESPDEEIRHYEIKGTPELLNKFEEFISHLKKVDS